MSKEINEYDQQSRYRPDEHIDVSIEWKDMGNTVHPRYCFFIYQINNQIIQEFIAHPYQYEHYCENEKKIEDGQCQINEGKPGLEDTSYETHMKFFLVRHCTTGFFILLFFISIPDIQEYDTEKERKSCDVGFNKSRKKEIGYKGENTYEKS